MEKQQQADLQGILLMDKPAGFTSHDVVAKLRGILHTRRIGHGGTLDPMATGVLPVFVGGATKAADYAAAQDKEYIAGFTLGYRTDTQDTTGETIEISERYAAQALVKRAIVQMQGEQQQVPPMYSAVKVGGKKLYELARRGEEIERPARTITVQEIELLDFDENAQKGLFRVVCSKGTYVRTLVDDFGRALGTLAVLHSLVRTRAGGFALADCVSFDTVESHMADGSMETLLRPVDSLFAQYSRVVLDAYGTKRAANGAFIAPEHVQGFPVEEKTISRVYDDSGAFLMLGRTDRLQKGGLALFVEKKFGR